METILKDWVNFCEGREDFDTCDFLTLFHEEIDGEYIRKAVSFFPNAEEIANRVKAVKDIYLGNKTNKPIEEECAIKMVLDDLLEKKKAVERVKAHELLSILENAKPIVVGDKARFEAARSDDWNSELCSEVGYYTSQCWIEKTSQYYALFEAFYGVTTTYEISWYLGQPLMKTDITFDKYFDLWSFGVDYALTESQIVIYQHNIG